MNQVAPTETATQTRTVPMPTAPVTATGTPQAAPTAPPAADPAKLKTDDPDFAAKFAALTNRQKELFVKEKALKEREQKVSKYEALEKLKTEDPYKYAMESGLDLDRLIQGAAKDGQEPTAEDRVAALEKKISDYEKQIELDKQARIKAQEQQNIDNFKKNLFDKIKADPERYELIHVEDAYETVYEVIEEHFARTREENPEGKGEILSFEDAADKVEKFLNDRALKLLGAKKLGFKMGETPAPAAPKVPTVANPDPEKQLPDDERGVTLNANMSASTAPPAPTYESPEQARARIAAEFNARIRSAKQK